MKIQIYSAALALLLGAAFVPATAAASCQANCMQAYNVCKATTPEPQCLAQREVCMDECVGGGLLACSGKAKQVSKVERKNILEPKEGKEKTSRKVAAAT